MSTTYFRVDGLSLVMIGLVCFVGICVASFSSRYLEGDRSKKSFFINLSILMISVCAMVSADHLVIFFFTWTISNYFLTRLMLHKREWRAALNSSKLATRNFLFGEIFLALAFISLYVITSETSIAAILDKPIDKVWILTSGLLIIIAGMTQSGLMPFHRWLISSLNSPTPVSALMHAGLINGGGFLLARFARLLVAHGMLLNVIFTVGIISAIVGMIWKLMQHDVKRMLACSTMSQMGYMIAQCGLGLFPAAIAHLCWHGLFKAYLFLASGSAAKEPRLNLGLPPSLNQLSLAMICGGVGTYMFLFGLNHAYFVLNTSVFIAFITFITGTQFALTIIRQNIFGNLFVALISTSFAGWGYGKVVHLFENILSPLDICQPQQLNILHLIVMLILGGIWLSSMFMRNQNGQSYPAWMLNIYVQMINASQPHPNTITAYRNAYKF